VSETESALAPPRTRRRAAALAMLVAAAIPLAVLVGSGAGFVLDPRERAWLMHGDSAQHLVAWSYYAREPRHWPPATIERWPAPLGTTIGLADAIPLVAMPLKAIAGERAADLQYFGLWSALCLAALGASAALFLLEARGGPLLAALGGGLVALSPVVWDRLTRGHASLAAHALLVGLFVAWLRYFRSGGARGPLVAAGALVLASSAIHPYLLLMAAALMLAMVALGSRRFGLAALRVAVLPGAATLGLSLLGTWLAGFLSLPGRALVAGGFGGFEADLLAPFNSAAVTRWMPPLFAGDPHREGFAFLGAGLVALVALAVASCGFERVASRRRGDDPARPAPIPGLRDLAWAAIALAAVAVLPGLTVGGHRLLDLSRPLSPLEPFFDAVRANGRLVWPLQLLLALGALLALRRFAARPVAIGCILVAALVLQVSDAPSWPWHGPSTGETRSRLADRLAAPVPSDDGIVELALVPAYLQSGTGIHCGAKRLSDDWIEPALLAARRGWRFNSGYLARMDAGAVEEACAASSVLAVRDAPRTGVYYLVSRREALILERRRGFRCERVARNERLCRFAGGPVARRQGETRLHQEVVPDSKPSE
jgi:hypothetical protein